MQVAWTLIATTVAAQHVNYAHKLCKFLHVQQTFIFMLRIAIFITETDLT